MAPWIAGWIEIQAGKVQEAVAPFREGRGHGLAGVRLRMARLRTRGLGRSNPRVAALDDLKKRSLRGSVTAFDLALVYLGQGDHARALSDLEQAYATDSQWLGWLGATGRSTRSARSLASRR